MTTDAGRATRTRFAVALALAGWMGAALAQQAGDGGMIVIPGRGESAQTALANANAASARGARLGSEGIETRMVRLRKAWRAAPDRARPASRGTTRHRAPAGRRA